MRREGEIANPVYQRAPVFAWMIPELQRMARSLGYAIAVHGSLTRDLDLIAVPWIETASSEEELIEAVCHLVGGEIVRVPTPGWEGMVSPGIKPHGRKAWSIYFSGHSFYIDLSVMPRGL